MFEQNEMTILRIFLAELVSAVSQNIVFRSYGVRQHSFPLQSKWHIDKRIGLPAYARFTQHAILFQSKKSKMSLQKEEAGHPGVIRMIM